MSVFPRKAMLHKRKQQCMVLGLFPSNDGGYPTVHAAVEYADGAMDLVKVGEIVFTEPLLHASPPSVQPFYNQLLVWLRGGWGHNEPAKAALLADHVEKRLKNAEYNSGSWALVQHRDWTQNLICFTDWLERNEQAGAYCAPSWGRNFSRDVYQHLREHSFTVNGEGAFSSYRFGSA